jgi:hypothetical protein
MKHYLKPIFALAALTLLVASLAQAETREKMIIALKTNDFELTETDISTLAIGESQTIETDSGKVIDILRTADGAEIYVDGELLEMDFDPEGLHEGHMVKKHVEVICDTDEDCEKNIVILKSGDNDVSEWVSEDGEHVFIHKEVEISCSDEEDGSNCSDHTVWISDGEEMDLGELHEMHEGEEGYKVIIKKEVITEN